jgi:hypothetical protein
MDHREAAEMFLRDRLFTLDWELWEERRNKLKRD